MTASLHEFHHNNITAPDQIVSAFPSLLSPFPALGSGSGPGLVSWSLCPHCRKFMAPESPRPLELSAFSQLLARDCRRGRGLPPRLRGHLLEVGSSAKCPEIGTRQETAESKIRKQVSEGGYQQFPSTGTSSYRSVYCTTITHRITITQELCAHQSQPLHFKIFTCFVHLNKLDKYLIK